MVTRITADRRRRRN